MKREQIVDMIGHAPDAYVEDAGKHGLNPRQKRRLSRRTKWLGGIAAVLAVVLLFQLPSIPMMITAKAVSEPTASRRLEHDDFYTAESFDREAFEQMTAAREATLSLAIPSLASFTAGCAQTAIGGTDAVNRLFSPVNAYIGLAMTGELVSGQTQTQILDALGAKTTDDLRAYVSTVWEEVERERGGEICSIANSLWLDRDITYVQKTMDDLAYHYYASVYEGDLGSARTERDITAWMQNNTRGMITKRQPSGIPPEDQLLTLASAIFFQSKWRDAFRASENTTAPFHAADGDTLCTFMNKKEAHMYYFWEEDFGAVAMGLKNGSTMWFILPDADKTVDDVLDDSAFTDVITQSEFRSEESTNSRYMKVNLSVPQFDVSSSIDLKEALQSMGVTDVFDPLQSDFSASVVSETGVPPYIAAVRQNVRVKIDEKGVTAAAYIEIPGAGAAAPPDEVIDFILDRPFVFAITKSRIPLFVGTVNCP